MKQSKIISGLDGKWATIEKADYVLIVKTYNYFGFYGVFVLLYFILFFVFCSLTYQLHV